MTALIDSLSTLTGRTGCVRRKPRDPGEECQRPLQGSVSSRFPMSDTAVFFDPTPRRWWWIKRVGTLLGLLAVVATSVWLVSLFTVPFLPGDPGITSVNRLTLRPSIRFPPHPS